MFQSGPVLWLQSFATEWLSVLMAIVSDGAKSPVYFALALAIMFGVNFRAGLVLIQLLLWTGIVTQFAKELLGLPRPAEVDAAVQLPGERLPNTATMRSEADGFLQFPDADAIRHFRGLADPEFGFPSGHVSLSTTFWIGSAALLHSRRIAAAGGTCIVLVALARMYLGRHYLADVIGGCVLGLAIVGGFWWLRKWSDRHLNRLSHLRWTNFIVLAGVAALPLASVVQSIAVPTALTGRLVAFTILAELLPRSGLPRDGGGFVQRMARVATAWLLFVLAHQGLEAAMGSVGWSAHVMGKFLTGLLPPFACVAGTIWLCGKAGLYPPTPEQNPDIRLMLHSGHRAVRDSGGL